MIALICAMGPGREIGFNNQLIWRISEDLKRFKRITMGHPIIMGRLTYESIGRPLPGRTNIVVTRNHEYQAEGCVLCHSLEDAVKVAEHEDDDVFVIGGGQIYEQALPIADRLYLTLVSDDAPKQCDVYFPDYSEFTTVLDEEQVTAATPPYSFLTLER